MHPASSGAVTSLTTSPWCRTSSQTLSTSNVEDLTWNFARNAQGTQDVIHNGQHADTSAFVVAGARLYIGKVVQVLWDPINGNRYSANNSDTLSGNNPKAIPGAVLMYAVGVSNDAGRRARPASTSPTICRAPAKSLPGNTNAVAGINVPQNVSVTLNAVPVSLDVPDSPNLNADQLSHVRGIRLRRRPRRSRRRNPEVTVSLGACAANERGVIVYFVTLQ